MSVKTQGDNHAHPHRIPDPLPRRCPRRPSRHRRRRWTPPRHPGLLHPRRLGYGGDAIYIVLDRKPKTTELTRLRRVRNILANPQASLVVDHYDEDWQTLRYILVSCRAGLLNGDEPEAASP